MCLFIIKSFYERALAGLKGKFTTRLHCTFIIRITKLHKGKLTQRYLSNK